MTNAQPETVLPRPVSMEELDAALTAPAAANAADLMAPTRRFIFTQEELAKLIATERTLERMAWTSFSVAARQTWMQTRYGRKFYPFAPEPEHVFIDDIAAALSKLCRYGGHTTKFYSVAEHSVLVSQVVPREHALAALMHDASEAYCVDLPRPIKRNLHLYDVIEDGIWWAVAKRFSLPAVMAECVKVADDAVLLTEREHVMVPTGEPWSVPGTPADVLVRGLWPEQAERLFLDRFNELYLGA